MANALKKTPDERGIYPYVENIIDFTGYPVSDWEYAADVSGLSGVSRNYWKYAPTQDAKCAAMNKAEQDAVDAALAMLPVEEGQLFVDTYTYAADEIHDIYLPYPLTNSIVHVMDPNVQEMVGGSLVSATGTGWDPGNVSTGEANINNGNFTDLCYNNSSTNNTPGVIFGIDMGTPTAVMAMKRYDYSATYYDTQWQFIGTNDSLAGKDTNGRFTLGGSPNVSWEVIFTQNQSAACLAATGGCLKAFTEKTYRYYGVRCVTSFNATYTIISELELYAGGTIQTVEKKLSVGVDYEYMSISSTHVCIQNLAAESKELKTIVMGAA